MKLIGEKKHKDHDYNVVIDTYKKYRGIIEKSSIRPLNEQNDRLNQDRTSLINRKNEITH